MEGIDHITILKNTGVSMGLNYTLRPTVVQPFKILYSLVRALCNMKILQKIKCLHEIL